MNLGTLLRGNFSSLDPNLKSQLYLESGFLKAAAQKALRKHRFQSENADKRSTY